MPNAVHEVATKVDEQQQFEGLQREGLFAHRRAFDEGGQALAFLQLDTGGEGGQVQHHEPRYLVQRPSHREQVEEDRPAGR